MSRTDLVWFRLKFPRELDEGAVIAALTVFSGVSHQTRLVLDVTATDAGITHYLAVTTASTETVAASLRAAVPSLRLTADDPPEPVTDNRMLLQLSPMVAALRSGNPASASAALLASLYPLGKREAVRLRWQLRPAARPGMPLRQIQAEDGQQKTLRSKLMEPGLAAFGSLSVSAPSPGRRRQLIQRSAAVLRSLATPHGRLVGDIPLLGQMARVVGRRGRFFSVPELATVIGWPIGKGLDLPGLELGAAKRLVPGQSLPRTGRVLGVSDFGDGDRTVALSPAASTKGLYALGPTGTGKTSLLKNLITSDLEQGRGLMVVETNGDLIEELTDLIPEDRIDDVVFLDPTDPDFAVGFNPFASSASPPLIADQIGELFERLWKAFWGPRSAQLAHMGLLTLARRKGSSLLDLPRLYLDDSFRARVLADLNDPLGLGPDWQWFESLSSAEQTTVTSPLLNKARQFVARPSIRPIVGQAHPRISLRQIIEGQKILLVNLPKGLIGAETAQLLGCLILTSAWLALAERTEVARERRKPFGIYVDEVQDFASAPIPWDEMFAQGRKYGLSLTVAHQNLSQIPRALKEVVLANARSKVAFTLSGSDARIMERLFAPALSADDLQALDPYGVAAMVALDDGSVSRPVTLKTPLPPKPTGSAEAVREASRRQFARPRDEIEADLRAQVEVVKAPPVPVGRKRRSSA